MRQDPFDRRVVERQRDVHRVVIADGECRSSIDRAPARRELASIIRRPSESWTLIQQPGAISTGESQRFRRRAVVGSRRAGGLAAVEHEIVTTLFDLGRQVTAVLDFDELLTKIPKLIAPADLVRRIRRLSARRAARRAARGLRGRLSGHRRADRLKLGQGLVGAAVASQQPLLVNDVASDPRYVEIVPGMASELVVPLLHKSKADRRAEPAQPQRISSRSTTSRCCVSSPRTSRSRIVNARLFEQSRHDAEAFETLAEIGREVASVLDLDELFARIAQLTKRVIDYRTFGILLLNDDDELEIKIAVHFGEKRDVPRVRARRGHRRLRGAAPRGGARRRRLAGSALHQGRARRAIRARDPDDDQGSLHRRRRSREPGARRVHQARRRDPDAARQPGGGGDRERAAVRRAARQRSAAREGSALRAARADRRCCRPSCPSG